MSDIVEAVKEFLLNEFLPGENPAELTVTTPLRSSGILDSIATLKLVDFLEERFEIRIEPHELDGDTLDSLAGIERLVSAKRAG
jgi:acyl carrier protein